MPVSLVKSLSSSTSALAGSQAAQHMVSDFDCAAAGEAVSAAIPPKNQPKRDFEAWLSSSNGARLAAAVPHRSDADFPS